MKLKFIFLVVSLFLLFSSCVEVRNQYTKLPPGVWRATLELDRDNPQVISSEKESERVFTELSESELPFNFEVEYQDDTSFVINILNAEEKIKVEDIYWGKDKITNQDTIRIDFPIFDTYISAIYEEDKIQGFWHVNYRDNYKIPFNAVFGQAHRFTTIKQEPTADLSGKWEATFELDTETEYKGIAEFTQDGNSLQGTFMTETGDYRYLEGTIQGNKAYLSCFDGSHAFLFTAKILEDGNLIGAFRSGSHYLTTWEARRNESFELSDPNTLNYIKDKEKFSFSFETMEGKQLSLNDQKFENKVTVVPIFGTWCPNCKDAMDFLRDYRLENPELEYETVGLAFERYRDKEQVNSRIQTYISKMQIPFEILHAGYYDKKEASDVMKMLNKIIAYPTIVILDKKKNVRRIHTGFSGPATSEYKNFKNEFDNYLKSLINE